MVQQSFKLKKNFALSVKRKDSNTLKVKMTSFGRCLLEMKMSNEINCSDVCLTQSSALCLEPV